MCILQLHLRTRRDDKFIAIDFDFAALLFSPLLFWHALDHLFGAACQTGILSPASGAGMADVEQMKKIVPFVTCAITFGQNVCELMLVSMYRIFGVNVSNLNFKIKVNPVKQPIQWNTVSS